MDANDSAAPRHTVKRRGAVFPTRVHHHGLESFGRWIGWGIIGVANLVVLARHRYNRRRRHRH